MNYGILGDIAARFRAEALACFDTSVPMPACYEVGTIPTHGGVRMTTPEWCCDPMSLWAWWDHEVDNTGGNSPARGCQVKDVANITVALDVCMTAEPEDMNVHHALVGPLGYRMHSGLCKAWCENSFGDIPVTPGPLLVTEQGGCVRFTTRWRVEDIRNFPINP